MSRQVPPTELFFSKTKKDEILAFSKLTAIPIPEIPAPRTIESYILLLLLSIFGRLYLQIRFARKINSEY